MKKRIWGWVEIQYQKQTFLFLKNLKELKKVKKIVLPEALADLTEIVQYNQTKR